jgi:hypothetical protein
VKRADEHVTSLLKDQNILQQADIAISIINIKNIFNLSMRIYFAVGLLDALV